MGCLKLNIENPTLLRVLNGGKSELTKKCVDTSRFAYNGMEKDPEIKGEGNEYDYGYRRYDPRLGRWNTCDPLRAMYPGMSPYNYAGNSPISCKDPNGQYIIFINGYTGENDLGLAQSSPKGREYWRAAYRDPDQFINAAKSYFNDNEVSFIDGSGEWIGSTAKKRSESGVEYARIMVENIRANLALLGPDEKIEIVTHSMGAAFAEGMIKELMNYPDIACRIKEVVHFSPCDGDNINISRKSKHIKRTQVRIEKDVTLDWADGLSVLDSDNPFKMNGGYKIKGVYRQLMIEANMEKNHPSVKKPEKYDSKNEYYKHDFHFDTKANSYVWDELKKFNDVYNNQMKLNNSLINTLNNYGRNSDEKEYNPGIRTGSSSNK